MLEAEVAAIAGLVEADEELESFDNGEDIELGLSLFRRMRLMLDTLGTLNLSQIPSVTRRSLISQAKIPGSFALSSRMNRTTWWNQLRYLRVSWWEVMRSLSRLSELTFGVVTRGLLPPMAPGRKEPVSLNLARIFDTQP